MYYFTCSFLWTSNWNINSFDLNWQKFSLACTHIRTSKVNIITNLGDDIRLFRLNEISSIFTWMCTKIVTHWQGHTCPHMHPDKTHTSLYSAVIGLEGPESALLPKRLVWKQNLSSPLMLCSGACGRQQALFHFMFLWSFEFNVGCCLFISFFFI